MKNALLVLLMIVGVQTALDAQILTTNNTSSPSSCDGSAYLDSSLAFPAITWYGGGAVLQNGGYVLFNLCPGNYIVSYVDAQGGNVTATFSIGSGSSNPCASLSLNVSTTNASSASVCNGSAQIMASGGTAPYNYSWNNVMVNSSQVNNLCVGSYYCCVSDANGCVVCDSVSVLDSTGMDSILIFTNNPFPGAAVSGTLSTMSIEDCTLDYQNVGSALVTTTTVVSTDTLLVTWTLYDTLGNSLVSYNVPYVLPNPALGVYSLTLIVYCSQKSTNYNTIQITDHVMIDLNELPTEGVEMIQVINPFTTEIDIQLNGNKVSFVGLYDLNGRMIMEIAQPSVENISLDTRSLVKGTYFLRIDTQAGQKNLQLIKE